jgi:hypothetical protein
MTPLQKAEINRKERREHKDYHSISLRSLSSLRLKRLFAVNAEINSSYGWRATVNEQLYTRMERKTDF